jgi:hypothetical protein
MNIHYKIAEVWPQDHLIVARYWTDIITEEFLNSYPDNPDRKEDGSPIRCRSDVSITLPIPTPTGEDLENIIMRNAPSQWLRTLEQVANPDVDTSMMDIQYMMGQTFVKKIDLTNKSDNVFREVLSDEEIQNLIEKFSSEKK